MKQVKGINQYIGLMFKSSKTEPLVFTFSKETKISIHSYFVFFPFIAYWYLDNKLIDRKIIMPFTKNIRPSKSFNKLIEVPILK